MAPVIRRSNSSGVSKPPQRKSSKGSRENSIDGTGVGLITSVLRASADSALQNDRATFGSQQPVMPPDLKTPTTNGVDGPLKSLSTMADRVGKEVEEFAEKVDKWRSKIMSTPHDEKARYKATMALAEQLEKVAESRLARAKRTAHVPSSLSASSKARSSGQEALIPHGAAAQLRDAQSEVNTWRLFRVMLESEFHEPGYDRKEKVDYYLEQRGPLNNQTPGSDVWERFLLTNDVAREQKRVLEWLEDSAMAGGEDLDIILQDMEQTSGFNSSSWSRGWQTTREKLKGEKRLRLFDTPMDEDGRPNLTSGATNSTVTQLDPDAPSRQHRSLERVDDDQEHSVWSAAFQMLRSGIPLDKIRSWLEDRGESWRAISFGVTIREQKERTNLAGPDCGSLWRRLCYGIARQPDIPASEAALYGLLGGDLESPSKACKTWDDLLYVQYNALVLGHFQHYLEKSLPDRGVGTAKDKFPAPTTLEILGDGHVGSRVVDTLLENQVTAQEASSPEKTIQAALLSRQLLELASDMGVAVAQNPYAKGRDSEVMTQSDISAPAHVAAVTKDETTLRMVVHFAIILQTLRPEEHDHGRKRFLDNLFVTYMDFLRRAGKIETLPTYATFIDTERAEKVLGMMLADVVNPEEQRMLINLLGNNGMEVTNIVLEAFLWAAAQANLDPAQGHSRIHRFELTAKANGEGWPGLRVSSDRAKVPLTAAEEKIIRAAEWFLIVDGNIRGFFWAFTQIYESFLLHGHVSAAIALTERIPYKTFMAVKTPIYYGGKVVDIMEQSDNAVPLESLEHVQSNGNGTTRSLYDEELLTKLLREKCRPYYEMMQLTLMLKALCDWREAEDEFLSAIKNIHRPTRDARARLQVSFNSLRAAIEPLFHDFLTHVATDFDAERFRHIRQAYLPDVVIAYNSALTFAGTFLSRDNFLKSLDLATVIVNDDNKALIQAVTDAKLMRVLLEVLAKTSRQLLRVNEMALKQERAQGAKEGGRVSKRRKSSGTGWRSDEGKSLDLWNI